jgi:phosphoglycolate phosphatase
MTKTLDPTPRLFFFTDLDGTLEDSRQDMAHSVNLARQELGLPPWLVNNIIPHVGGGMPALYRTCFPEYADDLEAVRLCYEKVYLENICVETHCYGGIVEMLEKLVQKQAIVAVITNKPTHLSWALLKSLGIDGYIQRVMGGDSCAETKPSPLPLQIVADEFGYRPGVDHAFMMGDTLNDMLAGKAFGAKTLWCSWGYGPELSRDQYDVALNLKNIDF